MQGSIFVFFVFLSIMTVTATAEPKAHLRHSTSAKLLQHEIPYLDQEHDKNHVVNNIQNNIGGVYTKQSQHHEQERREPPNLGKDTRIRSIKGGIHVEQEERRLENNSITKLFSTPMNEWSLEQFALFLVLIMFVFILFGCCICGSCCGGGGSGGCCADILACWCCYECCCDDGGGGIPYGVFA